MLAEIWSRTLSHARIHAFRAPQARWMRPVTPTTAILRNSPGLGIHARHFVAAAEAPSGSDERPMVSQRIPREAAKTSKGHYISRGEDTHDETLRPTVAAFAEVDGLNQGVANFYARCLHLHKEQTYSTYFVGLGFGCLATLLVHYLMGPFDQMCLLSLACGSTAYIFIVGSSWGITHFFVWGALFCLFGIPRIEDRMGWPRSIDLRGDFEDRRWMPAMFSSESEGFGRQLCAQKY